MPGIKCCIKLVKETCTADSQLQADLTEAPRLLSDAVKTGSCLLLDISETWLDCKSTVVAARGGGAALGLSKQNISAFKFTTLYLTIAGAGVRLPQHLS